MASEPFVHAQILVTFDPRRAIDLLADMIIDYQNGRGLKDSPNFGERLKQEVTKLSGHCGKTYNQVMYAAREGDFSYLQPLLASSKTMRDTNVPPNSSRSSPQRQRHSARLPPAPTPPMQLLSPSSPTPPGSMHSGHSESRSSAEHIRVLDPANNNNEVRLSVKYSGLGLNFIRERALDQFDCCRTEECDEVRETHPDATGPGHLFVATSCIRLTWYRPQWRKSHDYRTEQDVFYIVDNLDSVAVLHGGSFPPHVLDQLERGLSAGPQQREFHRGGRSLVEPTASYMFPTGGIPRYHEPEFGYNEHPDPPREFPGRVHQPQPQGRFVPQQTYHDIETKFQASGSRPPAFGQEPQQPQYTSTNPPPHDDYGQNEKSPGVVFVKWLSDDREANEDLDLTASVQHFEDKLKEVLEDYLEIDPNPDLYKLKFSTLASKNSTIVKFKGKNLAFLWSNIIKWMQKNDPGNEPYQCQIDKVASPT